MNINVFFIKLQGFLRMLFRSKLFIMFFIVFCVGFAINIYNYFSDAYVKLTRGDAFVDTKVYLTEEEVINKEFEKIIKDKDSSFTSLVNEFKDFGDYSVTIDGITKESDEVHYANVSINSPYEEGGRIYNIKYKHFVVTIKIDGKEYIVSDIREATQSELFELYH